MQWAKQLEQEKLQKLNRWDGSTWTNSTTTHSKKVKKASYMAMSAGSKSNRYRHRPASAPNQGNNKRDSKSSPTTVSNVFNINTLTTTTSPSEETYYYSSATNNDSDTNSSNYNKKTKKKKKKKKENETDEDEPLPAATNFYG